MMNIVIPANLVPDLVEELTVDETGAALDMTWVSLILNEFDDHAIEQGILLKERVGGHVTVIVPDVEGADDVLHAAAAKGADRLVKLTGDFEAGINNHALARMFGSFLEESDPDLILTGVQAHDDLDGQVGPLLAGSLGFPYVGYVAGVVPENGSVTVRKEYPGGLIAEMNVQTPAVLGVQAADEPPRYVAISKIRQAMKTTTIEEHAAEPPEESRGPAVHRMFPPDVGERATMLEGDLDEVARQVLRILDDAGASV